MSWDRIKRQEEILREKIATIVIERVSDPRMGFVTVTRVELTRDRREAAVYYTVMGEDSQRRTTERALSSAAPHIQERIGRTLRMRRTPVLRFVYDESVRKESRMRDLLDEVAAEWRQDAPDAASPDAGPETEFETETETADAEADANAADADARSDHPDADASDTAGADPVGGAGADAADGGATDPPRSPEDRPSP